ncbi:MAG: glutamate synthase large subunit [Clostridia bacterium]|nr:glutamate synthase large subunit [Clostridia bacterium]
MKGLYDERFEHDACGIGAVINIKGKKEYKVLNDALKIVEKLEHRAGKDATGEVGDGVGIMVQISHDFFAKNSGFELGGERDYGVGMFFFPQDTLKRRQAMKMFELISEKEGVSVIGWRSVPINSEILGKKAKDSMPYIVQCFVKRPENVAKGIDFDRKLYVIRRVFEHSGEGTYVVSLSSRTIVYKGMFLVGQLRNFYLDLQSEDYKSAIAMVHSRFSTNTNPSWERAHPNRFLLHNGEINTIRGNVDRMIAREETMKSSVLADDMDKILPAIDAKGSDSAMLDNTVEFMVMNGIDLPLAMMITIPEPWDKIEDMPQEKRDMYKYYSTMMEAWDGPASILFSDGDIVGATLDRNGLRPSRYYVTKDNYLVLSSEVGVLDFEPQNIAKKSRLMPGKMLLVDTVKGEIIDDSHLKDYYANRYPYGEWLDRYLKKLKDLPIPNEKIEVYEQPVRDRLYKAFGYTYEDIKDAILPMAKNGIEATASMGIDVPLAVLSPNHQPLFNYFKQLFAQVTNPPIDAIREEIVTSTSVYVGSDGNLLSDKAENCRVLQINNPILSGVDLLKIKALSGDGFKVETVSLLYYKNTSLETAVDDLFVKIDKAYKNGANIIILSDRGVDENHIAIPSLLAVSSVEQYLIRTKKRTSISIILESAEPRDVHHFALLLGYGARAVNPYLADEAIYELIETGKLNKDLHVAIDDYNKAILNGIVKIASKMGISTIRSYQSAQIFEAIGINKATIDKYFTNTVSRIEGIGIKEIGESVEWFHSHAFDQLGLGVDTTLDSTGEHKLRNGAEKYDHMYNPKTIVALQKATRLGDYNLFKEYTAMVDDETKPHTLRGLLEFAFDKSNPIPIEEVEPASSIVKRFKTGAMSYGSISQEAHECLAKAMNMIGGKSNSGEGGELPERLYSDLSSSIKQVASGRFGVTSEYLMSAKEIQIKMAQGAKPGEGGHLPGKKVYPWIAKTRYSTPGVSLISPPPHHDIYSIEDLAQLIYDLKNANRNARISVKLVSEAGVGTIAAGVAKAGAQVILISGYDGGTGAAPKSSIHNAGLPWELGLSETHQTLLQNGLRSRVRIETDGKLMSGRDVAIACLLGAEEFGFATAPLVTMGCVMMRVCNLDTCPMGIATQNPELRKRFAGNPEYIVNFMYFIAEELREIMAKLGIRTVDEMVGHTELLQVRENCTAPMAKFVDMSKILYKGDFDSKTHFDKADIYDFKLQNTVDEKILLKKFQKSLKTGETTETDLTVTSTDRAVGTILGSEITKNFKSTLPDDTFTVNCTGGGGQSFGAFIPKGLTIRLCGDSNDYFGKGLSGGKLVVYPPKESTFKADETIIIGNVALYGATSGKAFINGVAGERFCVRNSGAVAVCEGVGDHGLEYMTGGMALILGKTGKNFAAGMSGGIAYVYDPKHNLYKNINKSLVTVDEVTEDSDKEQIKVLLSEYYEATKSKKAKEILNNFEVEAGNFKVVVPRDYKKILTEIAKNKAKGMTDDDAEIEAFYAVTKG